MWASYIVLRLLQFVICVAAVFVHQGFIIAALINYYMLSAFLDSTNSKHLMLLDFIYVKFLLVLTTRIKHYAEEG